MAFVFGIMGSPRKGSSERLLSAFMEGLEEEGIKGRVLRIGQSTLLPCQGCRFCEDKGYCRIRDGAQEVWTLLRRADVVVLSTPVFFYGLPAQTKALIDRTQVFWARRYRVGLLDPKGASRKGVLLAVGATKGKHLFCGIELTFKYFMDSIGGRLEEALLFRGIERPEDIEQHPTALTEAKLLGKRIGAELTGRRRVVFLDRENASIGQMAEAFLQFYGGEEWDAESVGQHPSSHVEPWVLKLMEEKGLDIAFRRPKAPSEVQLGKEIDILILLGGQVVHLPFKARRIEQWHTEEPRGGKEDRLRTIRDEIETKVKDLLSSLEGWAP